MVCLAVANHNWKKSLEFFFFLFEYSNVYLVGIRKLTKGIYWLVQAENTLPFFSCVGSPWLLTYLFFGQKMPVCSQNVGE